MDTLHAFEGAQGPHLDCKGRQSLYLSNVRPAGLLSHDRHREVLAFSQRLWLRAHRRLLRLRTTHERAVAPTSAHLMGDLRTGMEHVRPLCEFSSAARG